MTATLALDAIEAAAKAAGDATTLALVAEVRRLREALEKIAYGGGYTFDMQIARAALGKGE